MAPVDPFIASQAVVNFMLDNFDHENACFLAERVHAEINSEDSLKLLASCFYRNGEFFKAYHLLKNNDHHSSSSLKFLLAQCCFQMKKYTEAESILTCNSLFRKDSVPLDEIIREFGSSAAFALSMVGDINRLSCRYQQAKEFYKKSLALNPFLWSSFQHLSEMGLLLDRPEDSTDKLMCKPASLDHCLKQPNPGAVVASAQLVPTNAVKSRQSVAFENIGAPREVSTPWFPNIVNQSDLSSSTSSPFSKSSVILPSSCHTIATQQPLMSTTGGANNTHHHHTSLCGASKGGLNLNSISSLSMSMSTTSVNANSGGQMNAATVDGGDGSTQPMFLNVTAPGCTTGGEESMDVLSDDQEVSPCFNPKRGASSCGAGESTDDGLQPGADTTSAVGESGGEPGRRLTRRQSKLMAAQGSSNETSPAFGDTPANFQPDAYETPEDLVMIQSPKAPPRFKGKHSKRLPVDKALVSLSNQNQRSGVPQGGSGVPHATVPLAPTNSNTNTQHPLNSTRSTPTSSNNSTPDTKPPVNPHKPVAGANNVKSSALGSVNGGLVTSQQTNNSSSISNVSVTPLQGAPPSNAPGGLRRSSRLYNGSNQLKENTKVHTKSSISRRQRMERAPNKSNSITNVLNAEEEKFAAKMSSEDHNANSKPFPNIKIEPISETVTVTVGTQTVASTESSGPNLEPQQMKALKVMQHNALGSKSAAIECYECETVSEISWQDLETLHQIFRLLGKSFSLLSQFESEEVIKTLQSLPLAHFETGFVLECIGRAHCEKSEYKLAIEVFKQLWDVEPHRVSGLDVYSSALWHLKQSEQLSYLAQEAVTMTKDRPQVWCVVGNCFALQKEHEHAIQFLSRAVQVDPNYAYAYILLGLEYLEVAMKAKAENCFRNALRINERHYPAWCGLGQLYFQQEKYTEAEIHYSKALTIKKKSPLLMCYLAVVKHKLNKSQCALDHLNEALAIDPKNPLCKYHKAMILSSLNQCQEALKLLQELELQIPNESLLYFSIGQVYKKLGEPHLELMNLAWAMDLDPKGSSSLIKQAIEKNFLPRDKELNNTMGRIGTPGDGLFNDIDTTLEDLF
ncbi:cell division cycle protein 27 homolog isoform X2 [Convolutriloba macropyga]|uniref:cell division cycle protein 27 homolog isoform X2 n=1 Tax=Convolutriloba macropyga TaxID=536237 RepID=UPI003F51E00C